MTTERVSAVSGEDEEDAALGYFDDEDELDTFPDGELGCEGGGKRKVSRVEGTRSPRPRLCPVEDTGPDPRWPVLPVTSSVNSGCHVPLLPNAELRVRRFKKLDAVTEYIYFKLDTPTRASDTFTSHLTVTLLCV